jgi:hypothetical protein
MSVPVAHIPHIVGARAKVEMIGIDAGRHIASMQNLHACGDFSQVATIRHSVS